MEGLGAAASIWSLCEATSALLKYFNTTKNAPEDIQNCENELYSLHRTLLDLLKLKYNLTQSTPTGADGWTNTVRALSDDKGAFAECTKAMLQLQEKIRKRGRKTLIILWKVIKEDVDDMLDRIQRLKLTITMSIGLDQLNLTNQVHNELLDFGAQSKRDQSRKHIEDALNWISQLNFRTKQADHMSHLSIDTGKWFLKCNEFQLWLETPRSTLFCPGMPGAGKTMLATSVIKHIQAEILDSTTTACSLAYIYCDYKDQTKQSGCQLLGSLLQQIVQSNHSLAEPLLALHQNHMENRTMPSADEILSTLKTVISRQTDVFIVVDAVDESPKEGGTRTQLLQVLRGLCVDLEPVHILVTSRDVPEIVTFMRDTPFIEIRANSDDISNYVRSRFADYKVSLKDDWPLKVEEIIMRRTNGMFLVARILSDHFASLHRMRDVKSLHQTLSEQEKTPSTVSDMYKSLYEATMRRIDQQGVVDKNLAHKAILWVSNAARLLKVQELLCALAIEPGDDNFDEDGLYRMDTIVSVCCGLLTVEEQSQSVRLVHYTAQEYLSEHKDPKANEEMAITCLTYLCFRNFEPNQLPYPEESKPYSMRRGYMNWTGMDSNGRGGQASWYSTEVFEVPVSHRPDEQTGTVSLLRYAAEFWILHSKSCQENIVSLALNLLYDQHLAANAFIHAKSLHSQWPSLRLEEDQSTSRATGLHLVAASGLEYICEKLFERIKAQWLLDINVKDDCRRTPLMWAAHHGNLNIVRLLLDQLPREFEFFSPIVHPLCQRDSQGQTVLHYAAREGHAAIVQFLQEVDIELDGRYICRSENKRRGEKGYAKPITHSGYYENEDLDPGSRARAESILGQTPLLLAALGNHRNVVRQLSQWDKRSLHQEVMFGEYPIHMAAQRYGVDVYRLLTEEYKVDPHVRSPKEYHPFVVAADWNNESIVDYCLNTPELIGPDKVQQHSNIMQAATVAASNWKRLEILKLILTKAGQSLVDREFDSLLSTAVDAGNMETAIFLAAWQGKRLSRQEGSSVTD